MRFSAVILAGGRSTRMGRDKGWLQVDGEPLLARQVRILRALDPVEVLISGRPGVDYTPLGCPVLLDPQPDLGPMSGIEQALERSVAPMVFVLAVDLPRMTTDVLRTLLHKCADQSGAVPDLSGELEPLAAVYPKACHPIAVRCLVERQLKARAFASRCIEAGWVRRIPMEPAYAAHFMNWNRPEDLTGGPPTT